MPAVALLCSPGLARYDSLATPKLRAGDDAQKHTKPTPGSAAMRNVQPTALTCGGGQSGSAPTREPPRHLLLGRPIAVLWRPR